MKKCRKGAITSIVLFTNAPHLYKAIPGFIGVEMWCQGGTERMMAILNQLGVSVGSNAARNAVDKIADGYSTGTEEWKSAVIEVIITIQNIVILNTK